MQEKYFAALKGGLAGAVLYVAFALAQLVIFIIDMSPSPARTGSTHYAFGYLMFILIPATAAFAGLISVIWGAKSLKSLADAARISALSGGIAGIFFIAIDILDPLISRTMDQILWNSIRGLSSPAVSNIGYIRASECLCIPLWLAIIIIVATICGTSYATLKLRLR